MANYLIVGGAGFIGVNAAEHYMQTRHAVTILDNLSRQGTADNLKWIQTKHPGVCFVRADIHTDQKLLETEVARPPRHLSLFSPENLRDCFQRAGLTIEKLSTSARSSFYSWYASQLIKARGSVPGLRVSAEAKRRTKLAGMLFHAFERQFLSRPWGEEIVVVGRSA
jgi:hypothetical protein